MNKIFLKSLAILLAIVTIWSIDASLQPIPTTTTAFQKQITLQKNFTINESFKTDDDYEYAIDIVLKDEISDSNNFAEQVDFKLMSKNTVLKSQTVKDFVVVNDISDYYRIAHFIADEDKEYKFNLIFKEINDNFVGKSAEIRIDVTGGGPSVGLALARELRQYSLWANLFLGALTLLVGYFAFKKPKGKFL